MYLGIKHHTFIFTNVNIERISIATGKIQIWILIQCNALFKKKKNQGVCV